MQSDNAMQADNPMNTDNAMQTDNNMLRPFVLAELRSLPECNIKPITDSRLKFGCH